MKKFLLTSLFTLLLFSSSLLARRANAQVPPPPVACTDTVDPEFHSLRPYQASPCEVTTNEYAKFCGNTLTLQDKIDVTYRPGVNNCTEPVNGKVSCKYVETVNKKITIDLSGANLPIMGNTENVPNSQPPTGSPLSDAEKMNGYVSWYLNGVMNRAEEGNTKNTDYNAVNFSGPLNKLLPKTISEAQRIRTIESAKVTNHNQIIVCGDSSMGIIGDLLGIGTVKPKECYQGNGTPTQQPFIFRLKSGYGADGWDGDLSWFNDIVNLAGDVAKFLSPGLGDSINQSLANHWNERVPPLPWGTDPDGKPFTDVTYRKAYNEWRGKTCVIIPGINIVICLENILVPNKYADLFPYIPLSSTEDVEGKLKVDSVSTGTPGVTNVTFSNQEPSTLFFPHLTESDQLGSSLQDTFVASGEAKTGPDTAVAPPSSCTTVDVRSNKGDSLFASQLSGDLGYTASFSCDFDYLYCSGETNKDCPLGYTCKPDAEGGTCVKGSVSTPTQTCSKTVSVALSTTTNTPEIDDIWSRLVAGPTAVVKRIFPKLGTQIGTLKDIPGSTSVTYTGAQASSGELNLPHVGGISEYFLKGIQTMLRPKGYGEPISFGETSSTAACTSGQAGTIPTLDGGCSINTGGSYGSIPNLSSLPTLVKILETAGSKFGVPPSLLLGIMYAESAFNDPSVWTEANVQTWSKSCAVMPGCDPKNWPATGSTGPVPWFEPYWNEYKDAVKIVDPDREPNQCNLLDDIFALAKNMQQAQKGGVFGSTTQCFGVTLNAGKRKSSGCTVNDNDLESAIKIWENGYVNTCYTAEGSCESGAGTCPAGGDNCEKVDQRYSQPSHNACIWDATKAYQ